MNKKKVSFNEKVQVRYYYLSPEERAMKRTSVRDILYNIQNNYIQSIFKKEETPRRYELYQKMGDILNVTLWCMCGYYAYKSIKQLIK